MLDAVLVPGATLPLVPVAAHAWGRVFAALITTAGWAAGSLIAFLIARRWGYPVVKKLTSIQRLRQMERYIAVLVVVCHDRATSQRKAGRRT